MDDAQLESIIEELEDYVYLDKTHKQNREIIFENFRDVIKYCDRYLVSEFVVKEAVFDSEFDEVIKENFKELLCIIPSFSINSFLARVTEYNPSVIIEYIDYIISENNTENFWTYFVSIKGKNETIDSLINDRLKSSDNIFAKALIHNFLLKKEKENLEWCPSKNSGNQIPEQTKRELAITLRYLIKELLDETNSNYTDIQFLGEGTFSEVYQIGNKVLKIGQELNQYKIPNHRRLLQPLARANYTLEDGRILSCFQVTPIVDTYFSKEEKSNEKLYEIYNELRNDGIIWLDAKWENLGKLLEDNLTIWRGKIVEINPKSVGFDKKYEGRTLKEGDIVVTDLDMLYREENPNIPWIKMSDKSKEFEERYLRNKKRENSRDEDR